ncbi:hypothetical protein PDQ70_16450 [Bacillus cereus group sp. Bc011]|uniref:hypothetical protein n=1 Tax=unclassified Bacillus cereus group TaxID=2750818 RepID=UPI0022DEB487|nr:MULTISPECIES: hypothetical protein [unclassified Bacillus cereus group]MDA2681053.1 hypothetical protein [Bacillus cereus group sp. Bc029]MDA2742049.1 hypothetical protein [Bacillus cereus group sp. Bc011]
MKEIIMQLFEENPKLAKLYKEDSEEFKRVLLSIGKVASKHLDKNGKSKELFGMEFIDVAELFSNVFFDYKQILAHYPDSDMSEALAFLEHQNNPVSIYLGNSKAFDTYGNEISRSQFSSANNITSFFQQYLYSLRFCSMKDLANALILKDNDLYDAARFSNVAELVRVQPALQYQRKKDLPVGKFKEGTGFFDCGPITSTSEDCAACGNLLIIEQEQAFCRNCLSCYEISEN